jgi:hypothetical protein
VFSALRPRTRIVAGVVGSTLVAAALVVSSVTSADAVNVTGTMMLQNVTKPGGGVWLPGPAGTPGHYWVPDGVLGFCRVDPAAANPPFVTSRCNGTAKSGTQAVYDAVNRKVYVADGAAKSIQVVRFNYDPATENITSPVAIQVQNPTAVGGGSGGGRPSSIALNPSGTRLYVGYIRSGDIMQVANPATAPVVTKIGNTSDGRGAQGFAMVTTTTGGVSHDDLYVAESGGAGLSSIADVDGTGGRPACGTGGSICNATSVINAAGAHVSFFPGGLAWDGTLLYVGDAPRNLPSTVQRYNPLTGVQDIYSTDVSPAYVSAFDGVTHTKYSNITGIGLGSGGDVIVGDDPGAFLGIPPLNAGHVWRVKATALAPVITSIAPATGAVTGATDVTITGVNLVDAVAGPSTISFGTKPGTGIVCAPSGLSCTVTSPAVTSAGVVDVRVTNGDGQTSVVTAADQFTYTAVVVPPPTSPVVASISPSTGLAIGGTTVTVTGVNLTPGDGTPTTISFGAVDGTGVACDATGTSCTVSSPAGTDGTTVDVTVTTTAGTSPVVAADQFTYAAPVGKLYSYGITAPKGGLTWVPGALGGHYWVSDHSNGLCRLDTVPATTLHAVNTAVCDPGFTIGSPGQVSYEPTANADGTHWLFVPDNAVRSPGVWRLTFDPATETISNPVAMAPGLLDNLKTNATVLSADGHSLYVGDLVDGNIRRINGIDGDPRLQTVDIVAVTQPAKPGTTARGINGTMAMLGTKLFLPENNAATWFDTSAACAAVGTLTPCITTSVQFLSTPAPVFVAGVATDPTHNLLYISNSSGGANAVIYRVDASTITAANPGGNPGIVYVTGGLVPAAGSPDLTVWCSTTCTRPQDPAFIPGSTIGFQFAQGLYVDPATSELFITEDASAGARAGRGHAWRVPFVA